LPTPASVRASSACVGSWTKTASSQKATSKLTELDQIKSRFFANISHELRTPLTLMLSPLEVLIHRFGRSFDEETRGVLLTMHGNGLRLFKLINDLLDLVRLDSGVMQVKREPVVLDEFCAVWSAPPDRLLKTSASVSNHTSRTISEP
jgi:signal transduction histidine kinase